MNISRISTGVFHNGQEIDHFILENDHGMTVKIINYGGIITHLFVPDKEGQSGDVVLGFDDVSKYLGEHPYFGAIVGRYANRIKEGRFTLNQKTYQLPVNNGPNSLHGGNKGFDKKVWTAHKEKKQEEVILKLAYESEDMEEGYPGNMLVEVNYIVNNKNELVIEYKATTDKDTVINLTNHSYFNLNEGKEKILNHRLRMDCDYYTPIDDTQIPTGAIVSVKDTPFDFTREKRIGKDFDKLENGYDHNFVINKKPDELKWFARAEDPETGRTMEVATTQPGVQFYTSNFLDGVKGKNDQVYSFQDAFCLETQHFPDSPNRPEFPSTLLKPGETYRQTTIYRFATV